MTGQSSEGLKEVTLSPQSLRHSNLWLLLLLSLEWGLGGVRSLAWPFWSCKVSATSQGLLEARYLQQENGAVTSAQQSSHKSRTRHRKRVAQCPARHKQQRCILPTIIPLVLPPPQLPRPGALGPVRQPQGHSHCHKVPQCS